MDIHPLADIFPSMTDEQFEVFKQDIATEGLLDPIVTHEGLILDGRHRYRACQELGIEPEFREFGGKDPFRFIVSQNLHRRHLTDSQRAAMAIRIANMTHGGDRKSDQVADRRLDAISQGEAAEVLNVSHRAVSRAKRVEKEDPVLLQRVEAGDISLTAAEEQVIGVTPEQKRERMERRRGNGSTGLSQEEIAQRRQYRLNQIRELTDKGNTAQQIADTLGVSRAWVMTTSHDIGVQTVDERLGKRARPKSNNVVEGIVSTTAVMDASLSVIDYSELDRELIPVWIEELKDNIRQLNKLRKALEREIS